MCHVFALFLVDFVRILELEVVFGNAVFGSFFF